MTKPLPIGNVGRSRGLIPSVLGMNLSTRMRILWRQGKANINHLLGNPPPETHTAHAPACRLPYEIMEMIVAHIADLDDLKEFSLTCRSWYIAAAPHLHHTITLREMPLTIRGEPKPFSHLLFQLHQLGLMPLIKEVRVVQRHDNWFTPQLFSHRDLRYFSAFANVHTLRLENLDVSLFIPGSERYFGHFSPTLRSIAFFNAPCPPRQLSHFLSLFPNLDDIAIYGSTPPPNPTIPETELVPLSTPRLRGRLVAYNFQSVETWTRLIIVGDGLRFHYMELWKVGGCVPVLFEACAETLDTLRFRVAGASVGIHSLSLPEFDLSRLEVLRSLQVDGWVTDFRPADAHHAIVMKVFSTITSPVFSEFVILVGTRIDAVAYLSTEAPFFEALRTMNKVRPFKLVFLLLGLDSFREEARRKLAGALDWMAARGLLDFLDSPPTIRGA